MCQDKAAQIGDGNFKVVPFRLPIRNSEYDEWDGTMIFPMRFDAGDLGWLTLQRIETVHVADQRLNGGEHDRKADPHPKHRKRQLTMTSLEQEARAHGGDHKRDRQIGRD